MTGFLDRAARRRGDMIIPEPTLEQATALLRRALGEADKRGLRSPTFEAIRKLLSVQPDAPISS